MSCPESPRAMIPLLDASEVQMVLVVPPGFAADLGAGRTAVLQAVVDGSDRLLLALPALGVRPAGLAPRLGRR